MARKRKPPSQRRISSQYDQMYKEVVQRMRQKGKGTESNRYTLKEITDHVKDIFDRDGISMDLAPYRVAHILEVCADTITKTALIGEALGQPYLVAIDEKTETQCETGIMFFSAAGQCFAGPEYKATWEKVKEEALARPNDFPIVIGSSTMHFTKFLFQPRPERRDSNAN